MSQESTFVNFYAHARPCITYIYLVCKSVGVADRNRIPDARMTASTFYDTYYYPYYGRLHENRRKGAWCAKTPSDRTDYLQVDLGTVLYVCAVATQGNKNKVSGPPLTKFTCPQTVQTGTFTKKKVLKRFGKSNAVMIRFGVRYSNWRPYSILVIGLLKYMSIEICHGSYSFDCLLKAIITVISK